MNTVTFSNNRAYGAAQQRRACEARLTLRPAAVGSVVFTECAEYEDVRVSCPSCDLTVNNSASNYGNPVATPPSKFAIIMPAAIRSGAPLPINVTLKDGFNQTVMDWVSTVATIETPAKLTGSPRVFYADGVATFKELTLRGTQNTIYPLTFTLAVRCSRCHLSVVVADAHPSYTQGKDLFGTYFSCA